MKDLIGLEKGILGTLLVDKTARDQLDYLTESDFLDESHRTIIAAIKKMELDGRDIDYASVYAETGIKLSYITSLADGFITAANIENQVKALKQTSAKRLLKERLAETLAQLSKEGADTREIITDTLKSIEAIQPENKSDETKTLKDAMLSTIEMLENRAQNKDDKSYYTGIADFDMFTAGLHPQELTTIAARPGIGKSVLAMQIGLQIANNGRKVMFVNLEMAEEQICQRIISAQANIDGNKLRRGDLDAEEWSRVMQTASANAKPNFIFDRTSKRPQEIRAKIRKHKPDLVIIDYLQLLQSDGKHGNREQEVASITRTIKLMSLEYKIPILMLSQLNRNAEGKRPSFADLRESGAIEQDSDNILFIHKLNEQELYDQIEAGNINQAFVDKMDSTGNTISSLILEKQRNGQTGDMPMILVPAMMKFVSIDRILKPGGAR